MKTNTQLQHDVMAELACDPAFEASHIGVTVDQGIVTLTGHVSSFIEKWDAERAAQRVHGMKALVVELDVKLPALSQRDDQDIVLSANHALQCMTVGIRDAVKVMIDNGWITLSGHVDWQFQKLAAAEALRHLTGLRGLSNLIGIKPRVIAATVRRDIEAALERHASLNAKRIQVQVNGGDVVLSGFADTWHGPSRTACSLGRARRVQRGRQNRPHRLSTPLAPGRKRHLGRGCCFSTYFFVCAITNIQNKLKALHLLWSKG